MTQPTTASTTDDEGGVLAGLRATLAELSGTDVTGLGEADLLEVVAVLEAAKGAASAVQARATAAFVADRDKRAGQQRASGEITRREAAVLRRASRTEVALARRCSPGQADRHVGVARALVTDLPHTMAALTSGRISEWRATIVARETSCLSPANRREADRRLTKCLTTLGDRGLAAAAHRACIDLDQAAIVERRRRAAASRHVSARPAPDGMARLSILGPVVQVVGALAALKSAEAARRTATGDPVMDAERAADERGAGAWQADTALELLSGRASGQPQPVEIGMVMDAAVVDPTRGPGGGRGVGERVEVTGFGAVPAAQAREHLLAVCAAEGDDGAGTWLRRLWTGADGRDLVAMTSRQRVHTGGLRRLIELRDQTCRIPWCDAPITQIDHALPAARGGPTSAGNGLGVCQRHNLDKEAPGFTVRIESTGLDADGPDPGGGPHAITLSTPTGRTVHSHAPPILGHGRDVHTTSRVEILLEEWLRAA